jgi:type IV pilus assembly protein PilX
MEALIIRFARAGKNQSGVALVMVLIMLTAMIISGVALVRIIDSANVISGNFAFRQATLSLADLGTEAAVADLDIILNQKASGKASEKPYPAGCTTKCRYFPARSFGDTMLDKKKGLPIKGSIDGTNTNTLDVDWSGNDVNDPADPQRDPENTVLRGYSIRYVIDRQCNVSPVTSPVDQCINETPQGGGSKRSGATVFVPRSTIFYRVSIQVTGPRKTQSHVQVILGF